MVEASIAKTGLSMDSSRLILIESYAVELKKKDFNTLLKDIEHNIALSLYHPKDKGA